MQVLNEAFVDHIKVHDMQILPYQPEDGSFGIHFSLSGDNKINDWLPGELDLRRFTRTARKIISEKGLFLFLLFSWRRLAYSALDCTTIKYCIKMISAETYSVKSRIDKMLRITNGGHERVPSER